MSAYEGGWDCVRDEQGAIICKLALNNPANACLIAAAPDLLEVCKKLKTTLLDAGFDYIIEQVIKEADEVIKQAESEG